MISGAVVAAQQSALARLLALQAADGSWSDYQLPVGSADQWVTAYVGVAVARAGQALGATDALARARKGLDRLADVRCYPEGWGYNAQTGPDGDSTAWTLLLADALELPAPPDALDFLESLWRPDAGFATYAEGDAWAVGHPCVTPVVYLALHRHGRRGLRDRVLACVRETRRPDGSWNAYWWRGRQYAHLANLELLAALELPRRPPGSNVDQSRTYAFQTWLELGCSVGIEVLERGADADAGPLVEALLEGQAPDGGWPGAADLRVTARDCYEPWNTPRGDRYTDQAGLITTATCLRCLTHFTAEGIP